MQSPGLMVLQCQIKHLLERELGHGRGILYRHL